MMKHNPERTISAPLTAPGRRRARAPRERKRNRQATPLEQPAHAIAAQTPMRRQIKGPGHNRDHHREADLDVDRRRSAERERLVQPK
jgi:hypothetical protein